MNSELAPIERPQFALRLEDGRGQLVLSRRRVGQMVVLDSLAMSMRDVPHRLDLSTGVERFRHTWAHLETLSVSIDDLAMTRFLRARLAERPLSDLEVRVSGGDILVAGELRQGRTAPFLVRLRIEPAGAPALQSVIVSAFSSRIYAPHDVSAPIVSGWILEAFGNGLSRQGCSLGVVSPLPVLLGYIFSELGWKVPGFRDVAIERIAIEAGRIHVTLSRPNQRGGSGVTYAKGRASDARFLADYEAKLLFEDTEFGLWLGEHSQAVTTYERQLELHTNHPFLLKRLMQLYSVGTGAMTDARALATLTERVSAVTIDTQLALAIAAMNEDRMSAASEAYQKALKMAEKHGQGLEISQIQCAYASCLEHFDLERAEQALESALGYRRRLPGALRRLSALQAQQSRWSDAIRTRERLLLDEESDEHRFDLLMELGNLALSRGTGEQAIEFFVRASKLMPHSAYANQGLGRAYLMLDQTLSGIRSLDQTVRLFQASQQLEAAAAQLVEIGDVWSTQEEGGASAVMRYRQALSLKPGLGGALIGVARVSKESGDVGSARAALEELLRAAENGQSDVGRFDAMLELGRLLIEQPDTQAQGIPYLQRCLDGSPQVIRESSASLVELYEDTERWHDLVRHLEGMLKKSALAGDTQFRLRLAELMDTKLSDPPRALTVLMTIEAGGDIEVLEARADLQRRLKRFAPLESTLKSLSLALTDPTAIAIVQTERGDLLRFELNRSDLAAEAYGAAVACDPSQVNALKGLVDLYREQDRYGELASAIEQLAFQSTGLEQVDLYSELARINLEHLGRREAAHTAVLRALELDGDDPMVLRMLIKTQQALGDSKGALASYIRLHEIYKVEGFDEAPAPFKLAIGELCEVCGHDSEALTWFQDAVTADPDCIEAYERLQDLKLRQDGLESALTLLEGYLSKIRKPSTEHFLRLRIGRLAWRELRQAERSFELLKPLLVTEPPDEEVVSLMLEMATVLEDWPQVSRLLEQRLNCVSQEQRPEVLLHLAKLSLNELDEANQARQFAQAAVSEAPGFVPGLVMLSELAFERHDWTEVEMMIQRLSEVERYTLTAEDLFRRAVAALHCGSAGRAVSSLRIVEMMGAYFPGMWGAFVEGYLQMADYGPVPRLVEKMLDEEADAPGTAGLVRRCTLIESVALPSTLLERIESLGLLPEPSSSSDYTPPIVDAFAETRGLDEALVAEIDASFDAAPTVVPDERFITGEFASWVPTKDDLEDPGLAKTGSLNAEVVGDLVDTDEVLASTSPTHLPQVSDLVTLSDSATLAPETSKVDALASTQNIAETDLRQTQSSISDTPVSAPANAQDEAFLEFVRKMPSEQELSAPDSQESALIDSIDAAGSDDEKSQLFLQLAELRRDRLFQPEAALDAFWSAIELANPSSEVWKESVEALEDIHTLDGNWTELLKLLELRIEAGQEDEFELQLIKAATLRSAGRLEDAAEAATQALELGERAIELLVDVLERQEKFVIAAERLIEGADVLGGVVGDDYRLRAAEMLRDEKPEEALEQLGLITNRDVLSDALELQLALAEQQHVVELLPELYERMAGTLPESAAGKIRASQYFISAATVCRENLSDNERAVAYLQEALDLWADNVDALGLLRDVQTALGDYLGVADCLRREIELSLPGPFRGQLKRELAKILHDELSEVDASRTLAAEALEEVVSEEDKLSISRLLARIDGDVSTVLTSETVVQALSKTEEFAAASESVSARIERLENALGLDPTRQEAYEELADLYRSERRYEELASVLERHSTIVTDEQMRAELLLERAGIAQDHLRDQQLARRIWERVIDLDAADLSSTRFALISFLGTNPRRVGLERLLEKLNRRIEESASAKRAGLLSLRAELWHRHLGETNRARADLEAAIAADEFNTVALFALARIAMGRGELTDASAWVRDALHAPGAEQQVTVVRQILGELRSAFVKQDEYGEWLSYLSSIQSEHQDASMASVISDMVRDEND